MNVATLLGITTPSALLAAAAVVAVRRRTTGGLETPTTPKETQAVGYSFEEDAPLETNGLSRERVEKPPEDAVEAKRTEKAQDAGNHPFLSNLRSGLSKRFSGGLVFRRKAAATDTTAAVESQEAGGVARQGADAAVEPGGGQEPGAVVLRVAQDQASVERDEDTAPVRKVAFSGEAAAAPAKSRRGRSGTNGNGATAVADPPFETNLERAADTVVASNESTRASSPAYELTPEGALRAVAPPAVEPDVDRLRAAAQIENERIIATAEAERIRRATEAEIERNRIATEAKIEADRLAAEEEARARGMAWTQTWWIRLDPDLDPGDVRARRGLATSLGRSGASWALKLARTALEQEEDASVRARLLGALVTLGAGDDYAPFIAAQQRGNAIELAALTQLFGESLPWGGNTPS